VICEAVARRYSLATDHGRLLIRNRAACARSRWDALTLAHDVERLRQQAVEMLADQANETPWPSASHSIASYTLAGL
jgi:hypothetical protein